MTTPEVPTARQQVDRWLAEIGERLDETFALNEDGICGLQFGEREVIVVEVPDDAPVVLVHAPVTTLPDDLAARMAIYEYALQCNLFQAGSGGGALALDPSRTLLVLCYAEPVDRLDTEALGALIQHAVANLADIRTGLAQRPAED